MNKLERAEVVKAMETMCRCINNEDIFYRWLMGGVADGDINSETTLEEITEMGYCNDDSFKDLMTLFLKLMYKAGGNGGLWTDGITSGQREIEWR